MAKKPTPHRYADQRAFDRIMLLISTLLRYPGVGCADDAPKGEDTPHHDALTHVQTQLQAVAAAQNLPFPADYPATATIRKDLETLRHYGILERRMYRWGYYLGTGAMSLEEFRIALNALSSQAEYQGDPQVRAVYQTLDKRLRGLKLDAHNELFYPVRNHLNRPIMYTDPVEMIEKGKNRHNLFHQLDKVEQAISQGQLLELRRSRNPYNDVSVGSVQLWPLQLIYHDIAWYLAYEDKQTGHLVINRVDRFDDYCQVLDPVGRGLATQSERLQLVYKLLDNGWGLYLGDPAAQTAELQGRLAFEEYKVRFFGSVVPFILEGDRRHLHQKIVKGPIDPSTQKLAYVTYSVQLPRRSQDEFSRWVARFLQNAQVLAPASLVEKHERAAAELLQRYRQPMLADATG